MKKTFFVLLLGVMNCGCSTPAATQVDNQALISYDEIAAEIDVSYESSSGSDEWSRPVAVNQPGSE
jgi:uncharacterized protein YcfL